MDYKNNRFKRLAFALSLCLIITWSILGAGTSLAWFSDTSMPVKNIFHFAEFDLEVSYLNQYGQYEIVDENTNVFSDDDFFEPGYTQIVYLKVKNNGDVPFIFQTSVFVNSYNTVGNSLGGVFSLKDYLRFGLVSGSTEPDVQALVATRELTTSIADKVLDHYDSRAVQLEAREESFLALVVRMPEDVGNVANYRGDVVPKVELGIAVNAIQVISD